MRVNWQVPEEANRAILAIAFAPSPLYLGAAHMVPVIDNLCDLMGCEYVVRIADNEELLRDALCASMVGLDLIVHVAEDIVDQVLYRLSRYFNDASLALEPIGSGDVAEQVTRLFGDDPKRVQYVLNEAGIDTVSLPTLSAAKVAAKIGLVHFSEGLFGDDHLRATVRKVLLTQPKNVWHTLHFVSDLFCDETLSCGSCPSRDECHAVLSGWI